MSKINFGWCELHLLPDGSTINLAGQFYERITSEVRDPICVTALAVECGGEEAIICSCDLESASYALLTSIRAILAKVEGFPLDRLLINSIHSHTSIDYARESDTYADRLKGLEAYLPEGVEYEALTTERPAGILEGEEAHAVLAARIAEAARTAWQNKKPGKFATGFGRAAVGMCRRVCYDDGSAKMWGDTNMANFTELEGGNDSGIELMFIRDENDTLTGVIANIACPAQTLEHRSVISADYCGAVKRILREKYGDQVHLLPLISPAGDQCPRDMIRWVEPETPINDPNIVREDVIERIADPSMFDVKGCETIARRISTEIVWAYEDTIDYTADTEFTHKTIKLDMPLRRVTVAERDAALADIERFFAAHKGNITFRDNAKLHVQTGTLARYELQQTVDVDEIEMHVMRLGDIAIATNPYELFLNYGNQIRARSRAKQTFLVQLCCGSKGYLPTAKAEAGSHYSAYVSGGTVGHVGGELLVRKTLSEINRMW